MLAKARHHRSDALSSLVARIAIWLILVSSQQLIDSGLPAERLAEIRNEVLQTEGVQGAAFH